MAVDKLYSTSKAADALGMHQRNVLRLIHDGKLAAVKQNVRGRACRPRLYVFGSEIERYQKALPAKEVDAKVPEPETKPKVPTIEEREELVTELEQAKNYY